MVRRCCVLAATFIIGACPARPPNPPAPGFADRPERIRIAKAEARRAGGVDELVDLAVRGEPNVRALALRGLGRIGGGRAMDALRTALRDPDPNLVATAASALGVAVSLDEIDVKELAETSAAITAALPRAASQRAIIVEALGRAGVPDAQRTLADELAGPAAEAAGIALGRFGRRKIALTGATCDRLVAAVQHRDRNVRHAAVYALAREFFATPTDGDPSCRDAGARALATRVADDDPETRAQAIAGLARRAAVGDPGGPPTASVTRGAAGRQAIEDSLRDRDWRVAVEAVRALAGEHGDDAGRDAVAAALIRRFAELERGTPSEAHVVIEGLRVLAPHGNRPLVASALTALTAQVAAAQTIPQLTRGWIECLAAAAIVRGTPAPDLGVVATCGHGGLPDHLRLPLLADLIEANVGDLATRRAALHTLVAHADPRVRASALAALPAMWKAGDASDHRTAITTFVAALAIANPIIAGSAVDAAPALYDAGVDAQDQRALDAAIVARAAIETDPELGSSLLQLIGKRAIASGADACRAGLAGHPVRARAAVECLKALGEADLATAPAAISAPPVDVIAVIGTPLHWHLTTSRGELVIALRPDVAPWAVATIVALTRRGFYDGLEFHRVVPDFVVQGGDPTMSGWGGPGFSTPAEPGTALDGPGFAIGGVGIADAGRDSGGSQWFVMHSRAAHLDGRYTWIGTLESGQKYADALQIGDRVERAVIEMR